MVPAVFFQPAPLNFITHTKGVKEEMKKLLVTAAALGFVLGYVATAQATNGYFAHGYSIKNKGLAGAGVALPLDSLAASVNPAGMTEVGNRVDLGVSLFSPSRSYDVKGEGTPQKDFPEKFPRESSR